MWIEGQVYPAVTDRFDYLQTSPLARPTARSTTASTSTSTEPGSSSSICPRVTTTPSCARSGTVPTEARRVPTSTRCRRPRTQSRPEGLRTFPTALATFTEWNRTAGPRRLPTWKARRTRPRRGVAYKLGLARRPGGRRRSSGTWRARTTPSSPRATAGSDAMLKVAVDLPATSTKPAALLLVFTRAAGTP